MGLSTTPLIIIAGKNSQQQQQRAIPCGYCPLLKLMAPSMTFFTTSSKLNNSI